MLTSKLLQEELRPNCLLTKAVILYPYVPQIGFFHRTPSYLKVLSAHGYEILYLQLPIKGKQRRVWLKSFLELSQDANENYHIILSANLIDQLQSYHLTSQFDCIASLWKEQNQQLTLVDSPWPSRLKEGLLSRTTHECLDWAISLAECELRCCD